MLDKLILPLETSASMFPMLMSEILTLPFARYTLILGRFSLGSSEVSLNEKSHSVSVSE